MNKIIIFPGSFKPPHKGHYQIISKLLGDNSVKYIYIIISKKSRPLDEKLLNLYKKSSGNVKEISQKLNIEYTTKSDTIKTINNKICNKKKLCITQEQSYKIWKLYLNLFNKKLKQKVKLIKSEDISPIITVSNLTRKLINEYKQIEIVLIKSDKNKNNKRFNSVKKNKVTELIIKNYKNINSRDFRKLILNNDMVNIKRFIPNNIDIIKIGNILKIKL